MATLNVAVTGSTYTALLAPDRTSLYIDGKLPAPAVRRRGSGFQAIYGELAAEQAYLMARVLAWPALTHAFAERKTIHRAVWSDFRRIANLLQPNVNGYFSDRAGDGWYGAEGYWLYVSRACSTRRLPAGGSSWQPWLHVVEHGPMVFVSADVPDAGWREPSTTTAGRGSTTVFLLPNDASGAGLVKFEQGSLPAGQVFRP